ncbi:MAG: saccharopine dehydrogenase NADP-binding domain-containing protein [Burkholderiales bacterium]|nr:saccharopine dehydrogenase NADP-binding domain-containing protein [Burkholderiales bacterium]
MKRVLLIGGTGVFGSRLARHLAALPELDLFLTSRSLFKAQELAVSIRPAATSRVTGMRLDHRDDLAGALAALAPWLVIDASGPFQGASYDVPRAGLQAGAHVVDPADARDYICEYPAALDELARAKGLVALTGASSTPALSAAAVNAMTAGCDYCSNCDPYRHVRDPSKGLIFLVSTSGTPAPIGAGTPRRNTDGQRCSTFWALRTTAARPETGPSSSARRPKGNE